MSEQTSNMRIVIPSKKYQGAPNSDITIQGGLNVTKREFVEGDRTVLLNLAERFDKERQSSDTIRVAGKITNIFNNSLSGKSMTYTPFTDSLFYLDAVNSVTSGVWKGYPQYDEFSFFRTSSVENHIPFIPKSAGTYNWSVYLSYPSENDDTQAMRFYNEEFSASTIFTASDGVPFVIRNQVVNGKKLIFFHCGTRHNLSVGEWVETSFNFNGKNTFQVYSLGDQYYGNQEKVFAIFDLGYQNGPFTNNATGTFKRIININNSAETRSNYYIRKHTILTEVSDVNVTKMGFERNPFRVEKKLEYSALTPNNVQRVSVKDGNQTCGYTFEKDIDISLYRDNNDLPITQLFVTVVNKGYMGWFNRPVGQNISAIDIGWDFNFLTNRIDGWWDRSSSLNKDNAIVANSYQYPANSGQLFYYNEDLNVGDIIKGDFCEWNDFMMEESVLSKMYHKYSYNSQWFQTKDGSNNLPSGYLYQPHYEIKVRDFSGYVEDATPGEVDNIPDYAFFSSNENKWRWRDLYPYGYVDTSGNGVDHPFMNGSHYPFRPINFLQFQPLRNVNKANVIVQPLIDDCE